jgi:hypothetical protein
MTEQQAALTEARAALKAGEYIGKGSYFGTQCTQAIERLDALGQTEATAQQTKAHLLINRLILAACSMGSQPAYTPGEDRITDADIDGLETELRAARTSGRNGRRKSEHG